MFVMRALLVAALIVLPARAWAGASDVPCESPFVFSGAAVNVVILPYSLPASFGGASTKVGEQLGALVQLETILALTRDLGVNLAGVEIILNMRRKIEGMQSEVNEFMDYVKRELARGIDDWEQRLGTALVKSSPTDLVKRTGDDEIQKARSRKLEVESKE